MTLVASPIVLFVYYLRSYSPVLNPVNYNIFGVTAAEVEIDLLTGQHQVSVHPFSVSQVER